MTVRRRPKSPSPTVRELMTRLEQTIPCPVNPEEFYRSLFPPEFAAAWPTLPYVDVPTRNTRAVLTLRDWAPVQLGGDRYLRAWFTRALPVPVSEMDESSYGMLVCPREHPDWKALADWHDHAIELEAKLSAAVVTLTMAADDESLLAQWPALRKALGMDGKVVKPIRQAQHRFKRLMEGAMYPQQEFDDLLAQALLLPNPNPPYAWVGVLAR